MVKTKQPITQKNTKEEEGEHSWREIASSKLQITGEKAIVRFDFLGPWAAANGQAWTWSSYELYPNQHQARCAFKVSFFFLSFFQSKLD